MTPRKTVVVYLRMRVAWWLPYYLLIVRTLCEVLDRRPDMDRIERVARRGIRITAVPTDQLQD
jgi:hypothetical protein